MVTALWLQHGNIAPCSRGCKSVVPRAVGYKKVTACLHYGLNSAVLKIDKDKYFRYLKYLIFITQLHISSHHLPTSGSNLLKKTSYNF